MQIEADTEVSLFVHHRASGRLVFNPKAIEALSLSPAELCFAVATMLIRLYLSRRRVLAQLDHARHARR
jgi:hypothetical protein